LGLYHILSSVGGFFEFLKNHQFQFFKYFSESKEHQFWFFEKNSESKNFWFWFFQKPQRITGVS
jgi:hypothetical protein